MVASACSGQALSLLDCFGLYYSDRTRLFERNQLGRVSQGAHTALISSFSEFQSSWTPRIRATSKGQSCPDAEQSVSFETDNIPRKGRRKNSGTRSFRDNRGRFTSTRKTKQDVLSVVRNVQNAEDSSNNDTLPLSTAYNGDVTEKDSDSGTLEFQIQYVSEDLESNAPCPNVEEDEESLPWAESSGRDDSARHHHHHGVGSKNKSLKAVESTDMGNRYIASDESPPILPSNGNSFARSKRRKNGSRHRRKSSNHSCEEYESSSKPHVDTISGVVKVEYDAKIGGSVVDITECLDALPSASSSHLSQGSDNSINRDVDANDALFDEKREKVTQDKAHTNKVIRISRKVSKSIRKGQRIKIPRTAESTCSLPNQAPAQEDKEQEERFSTSKSKQDMCTVRWLVDIQLAVNQKLFLVGEHPQLGAWDPSLAIDFSVHSKDNESTLWQAERQVPLGTSSEYNYFVQVDHGESNHIIWRPGPRLQFSAPVKYSEDKKIVVEDMLNFNIANKLPALSWKGLQNELGLATELKRFYNDEVSLEENCDVSIKGLVDHKEAHALSVHHLDEKPMMESPNLEHVAQADDITKDSVENDIKGEISENFQPESMGIASTPLTAKLQKHLTKVVFPREEPWLLESMILFEKSDSSKPSATDLVEVGNEVSESQQQSAETAEKSIEILINSSKCTMERIAILENGKLVELLLKPLNADINVGNVYLGIVKKLLPGMTGVFVDIGHTRAALLTIKKNMYPFTFPQIADGTGADDPHNDADVYSVVKKGVMPEDSLQSDGKSNGAMDIDWETEIEQDEESDESEAIIDIEEFSDVGSVTDGSLEEETERREDRKLLPTKDKRSKPITVNFGQRFTKWRKVEEGMRIIVQVKREPLGKKGPQVCAFPRLSSRFWVLSLGGNATGVSKKIHGPERKRLRDLAKLFRKPGFELTVRTEASGQNQEDLEKDLARLLGTWKDIMEQAEVATVADQSGQDGAVPVLLHRAMGQTLSIVRDFFAEKVQRMVVDTAQTYHEVMCYLQEVAPQLQNRVELYTGTTPIFDVFNLEDDIDKLLNERVQLPNGAYLVIQETEALVSIDVNGGVGMLGRSMKSTAILEANLAAARQIAAELRLRDIGGIIVIDFIDMEEEEHESLVYEEMRKAIQSDRSIICLSEISELGLMELTRRRVRIPCV
ncbi:hypothetical protein KP509_10G007300 [Ceratopteris richardii]|uniref:CBM20 domain-containing protein n=1 Tax=Ceratopteris richardii TaxID=49495 RepID=A0A8T2TT47_CERRI|nr:hypothetical protein KP509_10G007300 [Ceratopteris richardii]